MYDFGHAADEVIAARRRLADDVCLALIYSGLQAHLASDENIPGAEVEVDPGDDAAGGVFVTWMKSNEFISAVVAEVAALKQDEAIVLLSEEISRCMRDAIIRLLDDFSFEVIPYDDGQRPPSVKVISGKFERP